MTTALIISVILNLYLFFKVFHQSEKIDELRNDIRIYKMRIQLLVEEMKIKLGMKNIQ